MSLDSATKRRSMLAMGVLALIVHPVPDATIAAIDQKHFLGLMAAVDTALVSTRIFKFSTGPIQPNHASDSGDNALLAGIVEAKGGAFFGGATDYTKIDDGGDILPKGSADLVFEKASGRGIKVDQVNPTFGFADLLGRVTSVNTGASKPSHATYRGGLKEFIFAAGKEDYFEYHVPHDYVKGTDLFLHVHWSHISTAVTGGSILFEYEMSYSKSHNQAAFPAPVSGTITGTASTTQYQQILSEIQMSASSPSGSQIDTDDLEPDGLVIVTFGVQTNNITSSGAVPDPFIHYVDIHYQTTGVMGTKDKAPDFYA